ncbi:MAG: hypothetical protein ACUZ8E_03075 [Candidatus Anammoxibacter sp.]
MRRILFFSFFLLISCSVYSQNLRTIYDWKCENKGHWGSFWWKIERTELKQPDGLYYYYIYVQSNSYFNETHSPYAKATTYIENISISMFNNTEVYTLDLDYLLFDWSKNYVADFRDINPYNNFSIDYYAIYPYSYSKNGKHK